MALSALNVVHICSYSDVRNFNKDAMLCQFCGLSVIV